MSVGHRRVYDLGKPLIGLPLCHDPCLMELAELPVGLESESPQFRPCQTAHGLQGIGMRQYERIAGRISGTDIGFLALDRKSVV